MKNFIPRTIYKTKIEPYLEKSLVKVLIGQRRVGKSYLLFQIIDEIKKRHKTPNIVYISLELNEFEHLNDSESLYQYIKSKSLKNELNFVFIDEIQMVKNFEKCLKSLLAEELYDIYCTGSNAYLLSGEIGTVLGGRYIEVIVNSLTYKEFLVFHKLENHADSLEKYLKYGGLPYLIHLEMEDDIVFDYLHNINQSIMFRDVVARFEVRNAGLLDRLLKYLAKETGHIISARSIVKFLKSQKIPVSINAILNYLHYFNNAMLISKVSRSDLRGKKIFEIGEKYYFNDVGLRNAIAGYSPFDLGQIVENIVFLHLRSMGYFVLIGQEGDREIDFVAEKKGEIIYLQVALRISEKKTMEREFENLLSINNNYPKYVITLDEYTGASYEGIQHIPLRIFLSEFQ